MNASKRNKWLFCLAITACVFWVLSKKINVYKYNLMGAVFEILWLPMIVALLTLPLLAGWFLFKEKVTLYSLNIYTLLITFSTILIVKLG